MVGSGRDRSIWCCRHPEPRGRSIPWAKIEWLFATMRNCCYKADTHPPFPPQLWQCLSQQKPRTPWQTIKCITYQHCCFEGLTCAAQTQTKQMLCSTITFKRETQVSATSEQAISHRSESSPTQPWANWADTHVQKCILRKATYLWVKVCAHRYAYIQNSRDNK